MELPSAKQLSWLMLREPEKLTDMEQRFIACITQDTEMACTYHLARQFVTMVRKKDSSMLDSWLEHCASSAPVILRNFSRGIRHDYKAVRASLELPWSNGQSEGQINKLKLVKRQMYGRAKFDLLKQRILYAA